MSDGRANVDAIGFKAGQSANGGLGDVREVSPTLSSQPSALEPTVLTPRSIVRRLTPLECERLMGLPDGYTECMGADSPRYKACGNGWATNCARWILRRIHAYDVLHGYDGERSYATVCSGIECCSVALSGMGWTPLFFSEIEPAPCRLLAHHYPDVPNLGDMTRITSDGRTFTNGTTTGTIPGTGLYLFAGGTPCQDVSVAGRRAGMAEGSGTRSSLAFTFVRLVSELRPRWVLWENVPGVLSSNGGRDFAEFVRQIGELGYACGWRTLDAQYTRVDSARHAIPQRRRRVWLVGHIGTDISAVDEVLFERQGVRGDTPTRRKTGEGAAAGTGAGAPRDDRVVDVAVRTANTGANWCGISNGVDHTIDLANGQCVCGYDSHPNDSRVTVADGAFGTIGSRAGTGGGNLPLVAETFQVAGFGAYRQGGGASTMKSRDFKDATDLVVCKWPPDVGPTITTNHSPFLGDQDVFSQGAAGIVKQEEPTECE